MPVCIPNLRVTAEQLLMLVQRVSRNTLLVRLAGCWYICKWQGVYLPDMDIRHRMLSGHVTRPRAGAVC